MSFSNVYNFFESKGLSDRVMEFEESSATVELAAQAVGCEPARIAKTMSFLIDDKAILIVTAGNVKIDNKKFKAYFHTKAKMIPWDDVENYIGHAPGGVCPFTVKAGVKVYLDTSLKAFDIVYPAAGSSNSAVRLSPDELYTLSEATEWIDVCKAIE